MKDLWLLPENELLGRITRSEGSMEDCEPKSGYHRSRLNEIFRCEIGSDSNGVLAYTEADGAFGRIIDGKDYSCGFTRTFRPGTWGGGSRSYDPVYTVEKSFCFLYSKLNIFLDGFCENENFHRS